MKRLVLAMCIAGATFTMGCEDDPFDLDHLKDSGAAASMDGGADADGGSGMPPTPSDSGTDSAAADDGSVADEAGTSDASL